MDDAERTRAAARDAVSDIEPRRLRELVDDRLADASMTPGVLTLVSARAVDPAVRSDKVADRAAGVQLIYEGLRLTRTLAHEEPWDREELWDGDSWTDESSSIEADLEIVAADVLVSRGFYILARTEAAATAVETVRSFGRDQTLRDRPGADRVGLDRNLEADVFELAVVAGVTATGQTPSHELRRFAAELARAHDGDRLPPAGVTLSESATDRIESLSGGLASSVSDP